METGLALSNIGQVKWDKVDLQYENFSCWIVLLF